MVLTRKMMAYGDIFEVATNQVDPRNTSRNREVPDIEGRDGSMQETGNGDMFRYIHSILRETIGVHW